MVLEDIRDHDGETTLKFRERLAIKAFIKTVRLRSRDCELPQSGTGNGRVVFGLDAAGHAFALRRKPAPDRFSLRRLRSAFRKAAWQRVVV